MKRKMTLSIALVLSIGLVSLLSSDSTVKAQNQIRVEADTGLITLGRDQILRLTVTAGAGNGTSTVRFRRQEYIDTGATAGVRKLAISSQDLSETIPLMPGEAASLDFRRCAYPMCGGVRAVVLSNSRNVKVTAIVFDTSTQRVVTFTNTTFDDQASQ